MCHATLCCNKSKTRTLWWGAGSFKYLLHSCAILSTVSLDFSWKSPCHKQASMQTSKQAGKPCMHTQAVLIRGQTWLNGHVAVSLQFFHLGNGANTNWTLGYWSLVWFTVYRQRPHTAAPIKAKMSHALNRCHIKQPGKCNPSKAEFLVELVHLIVQVCLENLSVRVCHTFKKTFLSSIMN